MAVTTRHEREWYEASARFRFAGNATLVLACVAWIAWFLPFDDIVDRSGTPLGGDFVMLYVAGECIATGAAQTLYDDQQNQLRTSALFPSMDPHESWPFRYPPTVAACMAPLSCLSFTVAFAIFTTLQLAMLWLIATMLRSASTISQTRSNWLWAVVGCPLVVETIVGGQSSLLPLLCVLGFAHYYRRQEHVMAGALLAVALYKPNVLALFTLACLVVRPRLLRGFLPTASLGVAVALTASGTSGLSEYLRLGTSLASSAWSLETPYWRVHGLAPHFQSLLPEHGKLLCLICGLVISLLIAKRWRAGQLGENAAMAWLLCLNSLFNPYVPIYDLVLLIAAVAFACEAASRKELRAVSPRVFQVIVAALFFGPHLSQLLAHVIGWQLSPLALAGLLVVLVRRTHQSSIERSPARVELPIDALATSR